MRRALLLSLVLALPAVPARADPDHLHHRRSLDLPLAIRFWHRPSGDSRHSQLQRKAFAEVQGAHGFHLFACAEGEPLFSADNSRN